jgi:hypothetical protein
MSPGGNVRLGILLRKEGFPVLKKQNRYLYRVMQINEDQEDNVTSEQPVS